MVGAFFAHTRLLMQSGEKGSGRGVDDRDECNVRVSVYSRAFGSKQSQTITVKVIAWRLRELACRCTAECNIDLTGSSISYPFT